MTSFGRATISCLGLVALVTTCSQEGRSVEAFCDQLASMHQIDLDLEAIDLDDSVAVHDSLAKFSSQFGRLAEVSPDEVSGSAETVSRFGVALADAALQANPDDPFDRAALLASATAAEPQAGEAMDDVAQFAARNCAATPS
ncbi:MAG: hypothetical protein GY708_03965 [Actinomycetia bacterium]|nr:hypothetical protein [Actinomycetes bacterium]MCP4958431.1 hypothetical protein [Actinomycetes bacterium]